MKEIFIYTASFFLLGLLVWLAFRRTDQKNLIWRCLATLGCIISLVCLAIPLFYKVKINTAEAILLTPGYQSDSLKKLLTRIKPNPGITTYGQHVAGFNTVFSLLELTENYPAVKQWHVLGNGLATSELKANRNLTFIPHLNKTPAGVISVDWQKQITIGEKLLVTGKYNNTSGNPGWLYLSLAGKKIDSMKVNQAAISRFALQYLPKQTGNLVLTLHHKEKGRLSNIGEIPVQVKPKRILKVLYLPGSPSFEVKFLKNYLAAQNHTVALRVPVSKGIYQREWINLPSFSLETITTNNLQKFDVLITDATQLQKFTPNELVAIKQSIMAKGLGLIFTPDFLPLTNYPDWLEHFTFSKNPTLKPGSDQVIISWPGQKNQRSTVLPFSIDKKDELKQLVEDRKGNVVVVGKKMGWGKVTVNLFPQTYSWQLAGGNETYASFWNLLLANTTQEPVSETIWQAEGNPLPLENKPVKLYLRDYASNHNTSPPLIGKVESPKQNLDSFYLEQDYTFPFRFSGYFWPRESGWHQVKSTKGLGQYFYVFPDSSFQAYQVAIQILENQLFFNKQPQTKKKTHYITHNKEVPAIYFFISFLCCAGFLWLEEKW